MQRYVIIFAWTINILVLSFGLAVFEIFVERNNGWGTTLNPSGWGRKLFEGSVLTRICEKPYLTPYHLFMFAFVIPSILVIECLTLKFLGILHSVHGGPLGISNLSFVIEIGGVRAEALLFQIATWLSLLALEDFLWFALNWYYPGSLKELLAGKIWWHTRWINLGSAQLPRYYLSTSLAAAIFLITSLVLTG